MKRTFILLLASLVVCIHGSSSLVTRKPGDQLWAKCEDFTIPLGSNSITIKNACLNMTELASCGIAMNVSIDGRSIVNEELDQSISPRACGQFNFTQAGIQAKCTLCSSMLSNPQNSSFQCVKAQTTCQVGAMPVNLPEYDAGCFLSPRLNELIACKSTQCPSADNNVCTGHGSCASGQCTCANGWFGSDCSINSKLFEKCRKLDRISGNICVRLIFNQCNIKLQMVVQSGVFEQPIYEQEVPVRKFNAVFQQAMCGKYLGCDVCLEWSNLELTETIARGCGSVKATCAGFPVGSYSLDCFEDTQVIPTCLGTCPNDCSGHGTCDKGQCSCSAQYDGDDCSKPKAIKCPNDCSGHGTCSSGGSCACNTGFAGNDCSSTAGESSHKAGFNPAFVVVPLVLIFIAVAAGGLVYYFRKKRQGAPKFNQFDLLEQDDSDIALRDAE